MTDRWPALPYGAWKETYATLHMWTQIVGKVALALSPPLNHSWAIALQLTPRGLSTRRLASGDRSFAMEFDFIDHQLVIRVSDGSERRLPLEPRSVADFYRDVMAALEGLGLGLTIWPMPVEVPSPIRFDQDFEVARCNDADDAGIHRRRTSAAVETELQSLHQRAVGPTQGAHDAARGRPKPRRRQLPTPAPCRGSEAAEPRAWGSSPVLIEAYGRF